MPEEEPSSDAAAPSVSGTQAGSPRPALSLPAAWQPITPRGVAAFATASYGRLFLFQCLIALLGAAAVVWFVATAWFPTIRAAIAQLPSEGVIRNQELQIVRTSAEPLAEGRFLGFAVDLEQQSRATLTGDVRVELHRKSFEICSLLGCWRFVYPHGWEIHFSRPELQPWWGAWQTMLLTILGLSVVFTLLLAWTMLATLYWPVVYLVAYLNDRELKLAQSWRMAAASLLPGALVMIAGILAYGLGTLDLVRFLVVTVLHFLVPWVYLVISPLLSPRVQRGSSATKNPFANAKEL